MLRILYMLYLWLFVVPVFVVFDLLISPYGYCWLPISGERIFALLSGNDLLMADLPFGPLSGEGERTGKYRPEEIVRICCQPSRRFRHIPYIWFFGCTDQVGDESRYCQNPVCGSCLPGCRFYLCR